MGFSRVQIAIAVGLAVLIVVVFLGYLMWLSNQPPVMARSTEHDSLSGTPTSISLNPLRDRTSEHVATQYVDAMRDGRCREQLAAWVKDYRRRYATLICDSESQHPLLAWDLVDWEDAPPLRILHYRGTRRNGPVQSGTYQELFSVTLEDKDGQWVVTRYDALY